MQVEVDKSNVLHISVDKHASSEEKKQSAENGEWQYHRVERSSISGHRSIRLPRTIDASRIKATVANGVLNGEDATIIRLLLLRRVCYSHVQYSKCCRR